MPCDTVQLSKVEFNLEHTNITLLSMALEKLGYNVKLKQNSLTFSGTGYNYVSGIFKDGKLDVEFNSQNTFDVNAVKRAYSHEVIRHASKRMGWNLKKSESDENVYTAERRF
jgi:hypothetical protein